MKTWSLSTAVRWLSDVSPCDQRKGTPRARPVNESFRVAVGSRRHGVLGEYPASHNDPLRLEQAEPAIRGSG